jgi:tetratricopeptide (TPR) repeat protein
MRIYDAFISYSQTKDKPIAAELQSVIQSLGKPWYRRRSLHVFRDDTNLSATPYFWATLEESLSRSRYLILLASPESAASTWVNKEVAYWLEHKSIDTLLIGLTDGELIWDHKSGGYKDWDRLPLPRPLEGKFPTEPKWVDLRQYRAVEDPDDSAFIERAADFAAAVHGMPKEDLLSREVRQQRRMLSLAWSAVALLLLLTGMAAWQWNVAVGLEKIARQEKDRAEAAADQAKRNFAVAKGTAGRFASTLQDMIIAGTIATHDGKLLLDRTHESISALGKEQTNEEVMALEWQLLSTLSFADLMVAGEGEKAVETATRMLSLAQKLLAGKPYDPTYVRYVAIGNHRLGDALEARGRLDDALARNNDALQTITDTLAKKPGVPELEQVLGLTHQRIGDLLRKKGDLAGSRRAFEEYLRLFKALAHRPKPESIWVRGWAVSEERVGDALRDLGDLKGALEYYYAYQKAAQVLMKLETPGAPNYTWRADLWIANQRIGDILLEQKDYKGALAEYQIFNKGTQEAAVRNPEHRLWQRNFANSKIKLGEAYLALSDAEAARRELEGAVKIYQEMVAKDPSRGSWRKNLAIGHLRLGQALQAMADPAGALDQFNACLKLQVDESAFDSQLTTPALVEKECSAQANKLSERASR